MARVPGYASATDRALADHRFVFNPTASGTALQLTGSIVWITGASSGIGRALVEVLADRGAHVILSARRQAALEEVRAGLREPSRHLVLPLDLAAPETFPSAVGTVLDRYGRIDVLVNNGGISQRAHALETRPEVDRRLMEVNYLGTVGLTKTVAPAMVERGCGRIVVVSSVVGKLGTPFRSSYSASKHALQGFFESLRAEIWGTGVGITMILPGFVHTDISLNALTADGAPLGTMDDATARGIAPEVCAERIARAIEHEREEVIIAGAKEWLALTLARVAPWLLRRVVRRISSR